MDASWMWQSGLESKNHPQFEVERGDWCHCPQRWGNRCPQGAIAGICGVKEFVRLFP